MTCAKETGNTDEKLEIFCDPCQIEDEHIIAVSYCEECNEYLCKHCHKAHRRLAATRDHVVKEQNDMPEKPVSKVSKTDLPDKCLVHEDQVIDHYCLSHDELCCSVCLTKRHQICEGVKKISDYLTEIDMQKEENDLESKMQGLADNVNKTRYLVQKSLKAIEHYHDVAESNMLKAKHAVFEHIGNIYDTIAKQVNKTREEDLSKIVPYKQKCDAVTFDMKTLESYFKDKKKCNKSQLFVAMKNAEMKIKSNCYELQDIKFNKQLAVTRYHFKPDTEIVNLKTQPSSFGSIDIMKDVIKSANPSESLYAGDADDKEPCCVTGLAVLSETRLVLADQKNGSVKLVDTENDKILSKVDFDPAPWDVTAISDKQVAVTVPESKSVDFLTVSENTLFEKLHEKHIKCSGKCYGITNSNDKIVVIVTLDGQSAKVERYELDGTLLLSVEIDVKNPQYVISNAYQTKIYVSDNARDRYITELSSEDFKKLDTLRSCRDEVIGMAVDKTGVLYYCDSYYHGTDSVYIDEKQGIVKERNGLIPEIDPFPKCLAFCNETNRLFVGKAGDDIGVYIVL